MRMRMRMKKKKKEKRKREREKKLRRLNIRSISQKGLRVHRHAETVATETPKLSSLYVEWLAVADGIGNVGSDGDGSGDGSNGGSGGGGGGGGAGKAPNPCDSDSDRSVGKFVRSIRSHASLSNSSVSRHRTRAKVCIIYSTAEPAVTYIPDNGIEAGYLGSLYSNCDGNTAGRLCSMDVYRWIMKLLL
uniref:Uncharacterized protein n=1 Tax=Vespula pensylvanica TaxID=30213 RepID=A0A834PGY6_VESPE|nr:hypothetical protein H0235_001905 [Vespula pensylvanica]